MPNGFHGPKDDWNRMEAPLFEIEEVLTQFAADKKLELSRNYHNTAERSLRWSSHGVDRLIQIFLEDEQQLTFTFWICAFSDIQGKRYWKNKSLKKKVPFFEIKNEIHHLLKEGLDLVESWSKEDLVLAS